jgi:hypothetical protein
LSGEHCRPRQQALTRCGNVLRRLEMKGYVSRSGHALGSYHNVRSLIWRLTEKGRLAVMNDPVPGPAKDEAADVVSDSDVARLLAAQRAAEGRRDTFRVWAGVEARQADGLAYAQAWLATHVGQYWEAVRAEAQAELSKVEAERAAAEEEAQEAQEWLRDVTGAGRYLRHQLAEAQQEGIIGGARGGGAGLATA